MVLRKDECPSEGDHKWLTRLQREPYILHVKDALVGFEKEQVNSGTGQHSHPQSGKFTAAVCVMLLMNLNGALCVTEQTVYTTPGSCIYLNTSELKESIYCDFYHTETDSGRNIVNISDNNHTYDNSKYQIITGVQAIQILVKTKKIKGIHRIYKGGDYLVFRNKQNDRDNRFLLSTNVENGKDKFVIDLTFTYNSTTISYDFFNYHDAIVNYMYEFHLQILHATERDVGEYECTVVTPLIQIVVAPIRFLNQTDNNIIYGQEGQSIDITCQTIAGHNTEGVYIIQNGTTLAANNSNIVTFSFIPYRHDNLNDYMCEDEHGRSRVFVKLLVNCAPTVDVDVVHDRIDCIADGFPQTYIFHRWEHLTEYGEHLRFINGLGNGTLILRQLKLQYQIIGRYVCTVSNGIPDMNGSMLQTGFVDIYYQGPPFFSPENTRNVVIELFKPIKLKLSVYCNPSIKQVWIEGKNREHTTTEKVQYFTLQRTKLLYTGFENIGNISGHEIVFDFQMLNNDFQAYKILISNGLGGDQFVFEIQTMPGSPTFLPENKNVMYGQVGKPLKLAFLLYSDPKVEVIWMEKAVLDGSRNTSIHSLVLTETALIYSAFGNKGNINGYRIEFETAPLEMDGFALYNMLAKNKLGVTFYRFEIKAVGTLNSSITYASIAATCSLLVYIIFSHIYFCMKHSKTIKNGNIIQDDQPYHAYDEIGSVTYHGVTSRQMTNTQGEVIEQIGFNRSHDNELSTASIINQIRMSNASETSSAITVQESADIALEHDNIPRATTSFSSSSSFEGTEESKMYSEDNHDDITISHIEASTHVIDPIRSIEHRDRHVVESDSISTTIRESHTSVTVGDGYENPYQIIIPVSQGPDPYSDLTYQSWQFDSPELSPNKPVLPANDRDYVNLRF